MPDFLPKALDRYSGATTDAQLMELLKGNISDAQEFFLVASADETWCEKHMDVMGELILWMQDLLLKEEMPRAMATVVAKAIQDKYSLLKPKIISNIICTLRDGVVMFNSFMFQALSLPFYYLIRKECADKSTLMMEIRSLSTEDFSLIRESILTGGSSVDWKVKGNMAFHVLKIALSWDVETLMADCERILLRELSNENVLEMLTMTDTYPLAKLRQGCLDVINSWNMGVEVFSTGQRDLKLLLPEATEESVGIFNILSTFVTEWICGFKVLDDAAALAVAASCPKLKSLNLVRISEYSDQLSQFSYIESLNVAGCPWISDSILRRIVKDFSFLQKIDVGSCVQLSAISWGELIKLQSLYALNVSRCSQISDAELKLILNSCPGLQELDISECREVSAMGFHCIAISNRPFTVLNFGRTGITDAALLEVTSRLQRIQKLDLTRCQEISEKGVVEALRLASSLVWVDLSQTLFSESFVLQLRNSHPHVEIVFS